MGCLVKRDRLTTSEQKVLAQIKAWVHKRGGYSKRYEFWFTYFCGQATNWEGGFELSLDGQFRNQYTLQNGTLIQNWENSQMNQWFINIPNEGDWPIAYYGTDESRARAVYLKWSKRNRLPAGSKLWHRPWQNPPKMLATISDCARRNVRIEILYKKEADGSQKWRAVAPYSFHAQYENEGGILFAEQDGHIKSFLIRNIMDVRETFISFEPQWDIDL